MGFRGGEFILSADIVAGRIDENASFVDAPGRRLIAIVTKFDKRPLIAFVPGIVHVAGAGELNVLVEHTLVIF